MKDLSVYAILVALNILALAVILIRLQASSRKRPGARKRAAKA